MSVYTIQPSFSGGEFSPSLYSRIDVQKYSTGLKKLKNFIVHPHGGVSNRPGLEYVAEGASVSGVLGGVIRLIPFEYSITQAYVLEFGHHYIRVIQDGGLVLTGGGSIFSVTTAYDAADLSGIKFTQSNDLLYLFHPSYPTRVLTRLASNNWTVADFAFTNGPFMPTQQSSDFIMSVVSYTPPLGLMIKALAININTGTTPYFTTGHVGALVKVNQFAESSSVTDTFSTNGTGTSIIAKGTWRLATRGTWAGVITIYRSAADNYTGWEAVKTFSHNSVDFNLDAFGEETDICRMRVEMSAYSSGTCYTDLSCDSFSHGGIAQITAYTDTLNVVAQVVSPIMLYKDVLSWQEGSWSNERGYPSSGAFYQDRMAVAATPSEPQTVWISQTGNYVDFGISSPLQDTDAVSINLPSRKMNGIKNLVSLSEILTLTSGSECSIGDTGGAFSPTTAKTKVHGYRGSSDASPVTVGNRTIAVQAMGSVVRDYGYDFSSDSFTGSDLSIFSTHLFKGYSIVEMAFQQEPDSIVWCVRSDGKALAMTYMKEQDVMAWSWMETDGLIESVCCIPGTSQNDVYFIVNRAGKRFIERMTQRLPIVETEEAFFLDSALTYRGTATTSISGLTHLEGRTVTALCNGRVVTGLVVSSGHITLPVAATIVHVGLPYTADFQTLDIQVPMQDGTGYGRLVKVAETRFTFLNSLGGYIGPDENNLDEIIDLAPSVLSDPKDLFTGEYRQSMASGYEAGGTVFFRQVDPLPVTILSVMPKITVGG